MLISRDAKHKAQKKKTRLQVRILFIKEKILNSALQEIILY